MKVKCIDNKTFFSGVKDFEIEDTFDCGQCFRWNREEDGSYTGIVSGKVINVTKERGSDTAVIDNCSLEEYRSLWYEYFDMERNYSEIKRILSQNDDIMRMASICGNGIRLLHQDLWEIIISFIISQNSNIPRIKKGIESLCSFFGDEAEEYRGRKYFTFPTVSKLASLNYEDLAECRLGYRDKYIIDTAKSFKRGDVPSPEELIKMDRDEAEKYLLSLNGIGPKVANCILLFGLMKYDSFPIDTWMKKVMNELYGFEINDLKGMSRYSSEHFGELSGFAQQYLFYYARKKSEKLF